MAPIAAQDPAVRSAIAVLATFHEGFVRGVDLAANDDPTALKLYNAAIKKHIGTFDPSAYSQPAVAFVPALIFALIEVCPSLRRVSPGA